MKFLPVAVGVDALIVTLMFDGLTVPVMAGDSFLSLARAAQGSLARGKAVVGEIGERRSA
ncbi:MAG: hypothetical protein EXR95_03285 [Gemmatimonadetes bacterium]|nr:hypothetical protein [Gemmatimonadota bacterium]